MPGESPAVSCWRAAKEEPSADRTEAPGCASLRSAQGGGRVLWLGVPSDLSASVPTASNDNHIPKTS